MAHVDACLTSVLNQTYENYEVIFVDNKSTDGSLEYVKGKFPSLIFVANQSNLGYAGGINSGLAHASGELIAPLNTDTEVAPDWLAIMVEFLDSNPGTAAVTPKILLFDQRNKINAKGLKIHITGLGFCRQLYKTDDNATAPERVAGISGCSYLVRGRLLEEMGGAPAEYFMGNDDVVVSWLLNLMGYDIFCVPQARVYHKYRLKMTPEKFLRSEKGRQELILSSLRPLTLLVCLPILFAVEFLMIVYGLTKGKPYVKAKLGALASVWRERENWRQKRKRYQQLRRISDLALLRRLSWNLEWGQLLQVTK
jgi:hypothetical protein